MIQDEKKNDLLLNVLANPEYTMTDFIDVGINAGNSTIKSRSEYINNEKIRTDPFFAKSDGTFDENKFNKFYDVVSGAYNEMAKKSYDELISNEIESDPYDIFASPESKRKNLEDEVKLVEFGKDIPMLNPNRIKFSVSGIGKMDENKWTPQELAQMSERYNPETGKFEESPENWFTGDHWYSDMFKTTVMATYEENDPEVKSGERQVGEYKINNDGTYYTEFLNGRATYNKEIISKLDLLTKENSWINRYDFFDSDDKDKNVFGSIMRNVATIAPMFIPHVGGYYVLGSILTQMGGISATIGKMAYGTDSEFVNNADGFFSQFHGGTSQYSKEHTFSAENLINMFGQVVSQIKEQRWLFKEAPKMFSSKAVALDDELKTKKMYDEFSRKRFDEYINRVKNGDGSYKDMIIQASGGNKDLMISQMKAEADQAARMFIEAETKKLQNRSKLISQIYMTGITTMDMYNEAKQQGASDTQAMLLTLGYSFAEFGLLNTDIGQWMMPELRLDRQRLKKAVQMLGEIEDQAIQTGTRAARNSFAQKAIQTGRELYNSIPKGGYKAILGGALSEGFEETSEEVLADITKVAANTINWLVGEDLRYSTFDNVVERYGMSLIGGMAGGGFTTATGLFNDMDKNALNDINTKDQAMEYIAYTLRNNGKNAVLKAIDKANWGNPNLSTEEIGIVEDRQFGLEFAPGTSIDNQDKAIKDTMKKIITMYDSLLSRNNLNVNDDESVRRALLNNSLYSMISKSITASSYVSDFNSAVKNFIKAKNEYDAVKRSIYDSNNDGNISDKEERKNNPDTQDEIKNLNTAQENLDAARENAQAYINGKNTSQLVLKAIFELNPILNSAFKNSSLETYISSKYGVSTDSLTEDKLKQYAEEYNKFISSSGKDYLNESFNMFVNMMSSINPYLTNETNAYYQKQEENKELVKKLNILDANFNKAKKMLSEVDAGTPDFVLFNYLSDLSANKPNVLTSENTIAGIEGDILPILAYNQFKIDEKIKPKEEYAEGETIPDGTLTDREIYNKWISNKGLSSKYLIAAINQYMTQYMNHILDLSNMVSSQQYVDPTIKRGISDAFNRIYDSISNKNIEELKIAGITLSNLKGKGYIDDISFEDALREVIEFQEESNGARVDYISALQLGAEAQLDDFEYNLLNEIQINTGILGENETLNLSNLKNNIDNIMSLPNTPVMNIIDSMGFANNGVKANELYNGVIDVFQAKSGDMRSFILSAEQEKSINLFNKYAIFLKSIINATRDNNISIINPVSFIDTAKKYTSGDPNSIWKNMSTIPGDAAKSMEFELDRIASRMEFYLKISKMNDSNNTKEIKKLDVNLGILKYKSLSEFVEFIKTITTDDDDKNLLTKAISDSNFDIIKKIDENRDKMELVLTEDQIKGVYSSIDRLEQAIYDIVKNNKSIVDINNIKRFIDNNLGEISNNIPVNAETVNFSPMHKLWYIASVVSMNPHLKHTMSAGAYIEKDLMPNALQMHSAEMAVSYLVNRDMYHKFSDALKSVVDDRFGKLIDEAKFDEAFKIMESLNIHLSTDVKDKIKDPEEIKDTIKFLYQNSKLYNIFDNIMFVEGVPGSGKTSAVLKKLISRMVVAKDENGKNYIEDIEKLASNIYIITPEGMKKSFLDKSDKLFNTTKDPKIMSHEEFLSDAFGIDDKTKIDKEFIDNAMIGGKEGNDYVVRYTGDNVYGNTKEMPSIILIDEATLFNQQQTEAINRMSKELGIPVIAFGDTSQIQNATVFEPKKNDKLKNLPVDKIFINKFSFEVFSGQFISSPKIGFHMRSNNAHLTTSMNEFRANMDNNVNNPSNVNTINTHYYFDDSGLYGIKVSDTVNMAENISDEDIRIIKSIVDSLRNEIESLKNQGIANPEYEKIGFIGSSTEFLKDLCKMIDIPESDINKFFDEFNTPKDTIGMERRFYIINSNETNWDSNSSIGSRGDAYHNLYTAMSRVKQGAIIFNSSNNEVKSKKDNTLSLSKINDSDIKKYAEEFTNAYSSAISGNQISVNPLRIFNNDDDSNDNDDKGEKDDGSDIIDKDDEVLDIDNIDGNDGVRKKNQELEKKENEDIEKERKNSPSGFNDTIGYTFNMFEIGKGFRVEDDGIKFDTYSFDGMNGLMNIALYFYNRNLSKENRIGKDSSNFKFISFKDIPALKNLTNENAKKVFESATVSAINKMHYALTSSIFDRNGKVSNDPIDEFLNVVSGFIKSMFGVSIKVPDLKNMLMTNENENGSSLYYHKLNYTTDKKFISRFYNIDNGNDEASSLNINYTDKNENGRITRNRNTIRARVSYIAKFKVGDKYIPMEIYLSSIENVDTYMNSLIEKYNLGFIKDEKTPGKYLRIINNLENNSSAQKDIKKLKVLYDLYSKPNHLILNLGGDPNTDKYGTSLLESMIIKGPSVISENKDSNIKMSIDFFPEQTNVEDIQNMNDINISRPFILVNSNNMDVEVEKAINNGYLKKGYPFVIIAEGDNDIKGLPSEELFKNYVRQSNDPSRNKVKKYKVVYINTPAFSVSDYLTKIANMIGKKNVGNDKDLAINSPFIGDVFTSLNLITRFLGIKLNDLPGSTESSITMEDFRKKHSGKIVDQLKLVFGNIDNSKTAEEISDTVYGLLYDDKNNIRPIKDVANTLFRGGNNIVNYLLMTLSGNIDSSSTIIDGKDTDARKRFIEEVKKSGFSVVYASAKKNKNENTRIGGLSYLDTNKSSSPYRFKIGDQEYPMTFFGKIIPSTIYLNAVDKLTSENRKLNNKLSGKVERDKIIIEHNNGIMNTEKMIKFYSDENPVKGTQANNTNIEKYNVVTLRITEGKFEPENDSDKFIDNMEFERGKHIDKFRQITEGSKSKTVPVFYKNDDIINVFYIDKNYNSNKSQIEKFYSGESCKFENDKYEMNVSFTNGSANIEISEKKKADNTDNGSGSTDILDKENVLNTIEKAIVVMGIYTNGKTAPIFKRINGIISILKEKLVEKDLESIKNIMTSNSDFSTFMAHLNKKTDGINGSEEVRNSLNSIIEKYKNENNNCKL